MPTLDQAARQLGISEKTLRKWMKRLGIERERHPQDWRYWLITPEQLQQIADERAQMPSVTQQPNMPPAFTRAKSDGLDSSADRFPMPTAKKRRQQPLSASPLANEVPAGMMGRQRAGIAHGLPPANVILWANQGMLECDPGSYGNPARPTVHPLTRRGLRQLWEKAHTDSRWVDCPDCPHQIAEET